MFRNLIAALVAAFVFASGLSAAEYKGRITKVAADSISVTLAPKEKGQKGEMKTFKLGKEVKVVKTVKKVDEPLADGLKNEMFTKLTGAGKGAVPATIVTEGSGADEAVTQIKVAGGGAKKPKAENKAAPKAAKKPKAAK
jgi:hypothetical protein